MDEEQGFFIEGQHDLVPYVSGAIVAMLLLAIIVLCVKLIDARHEIGKLKGEIGQSYKEVVAVKMDNAEGRRLLSEALPLIMECNRGRH